MAERLIPRLMEFAPKFRRPKAPGRWRFVKKGRSKPKRTNPCFFRFFIDQKVKQQRWKQFMLIAKPRLLNQFTKFAKMRVLLAVTQQELSEERRIGAQYSCKN